MRVDRDVDIVSIVQTQLSEEQQRLFDELGPVWDVITQKLAGLSDMVDGKLGFGVPNDGNGDASLDNMYGTWVTVSLPTTAYLGAGGSSPVTVTHNLDIPVTTLTAPGPVTVYLPNVRWLVWGWQHGDRTAAAAPPAAVANPAHNSVYFRLGDTVTRDAIDLRFHSDIAPIATEPLTVDLWIQRAVI